MIQVEYVLSSEVSSQRKGLAFQEEEGIEDLIEVPSMIILQVDKSCHSYSMIIYIGW